MAQNGECPECLGQVYFYYLDCDGIIMRENCFKCYEKEEEHPDMEAEYIHSIELPTCTQNELVEESILTRRQRRIF